jgi:serine/threonine protein kinase
VSVAQTSDASGGRAGRTIHGYRLLGAIGRGGMATVYQARQGDLRRLVALKELGALHASESINAKRFLQEARVAASLSHPNIVTVYDFFEDEGTPYIAMEYVPGGTLRPQVGGLSVAQTLGMVEGVLAGLAVAEQNGIVHRDIKPENLMVVSDGRVKITDFGIAKATGAVQTASMRTATGITIGTPNYMAPEQAMGRQVGPWTDLYSLGVVSFEMLVGRTPFFDSDSAMSIVFRQVNEPIQPVRELEPDVEPEVSDWIGRLVEKEPARRPQSAVEAWQQLDAVAAAVLGSRWREESRLVPGPPPELDTEALALSPSAAVAGAAPTRLRGADTLAPGIETGAVTVAPAAAASPPSARRRRKPRVVLAVLLLIALAAAAAAFAGGGSGGSSPASSSSSPPSGGPSSSSSPPSGGSSSSSPPSGGSSSSSSPPSGGSSSSSPPSGGSSSSSSPPSGGPSSSSSPPSGQPGTEGTGGADEQSPESPEGEGCGRGSPSTCREP